MMALKTFVSERRAANLLAQVRWRDGVYCPRCRAESVIRYGSYRCKNCDRTFNDQTGTVFEHSSVALRTWFLTIYTFIRLNTSIRQLGVELDVSYKTVYRRVQRFLRALDAPQLSLKGPVNAGCKGCERDRTSRARGLSTRGRGTYHGDKPPVFILVDRGTEERYAIPAKTADESTIRLLLADRQQESLTVYTDGFRAYEPLEEDDMVEREYVVHGDGEYADGDVHVNTSRATARWCDRGSLPIEASPKTNSHSISVPSNFAVESIENQGTMRSQPSSKRHYDSPTIYATRA